MDHSLSHSFSFIFIHFLQTGWPMHHLWQMKWWLDYNLLLNIKVDSPSATNILINGSIFIVSIIKPWFVNCVIGMNTSHPIAKSYRLQTWHYNWKTSWGRNWNNWRFGIELTNWIELFFGWLSQFKAHHEHSSFKDQQIQLNEIKLSIENEEKEATSMFVLICFHWSIDSITSQTFALIITPLIKGLIDAVW